MKTKICAKCKQKKSIYEFGIDKGNKDWTKSVCKTCTNKKQQEKRKLTKRVLSITKEQRRTSKLKHRFDLTPEQYQILYEEQKGCCAICGKHQSKLTKLKQNLCVDHDHKTGIIRGLLCIRCNTGLGYYEPMHKQFKEYLQISSKRMVKIYKKWLLEI